MYIFKKKIYFSRYSADVINIREYIKCHDYLLKQFFNKNLYNLNSASKPHKKK